MCHGTWSASVSTDIFVIMYSIRRHRRILLGIAFAGLLGGMGMIGCVRSDNKTASGDKTPEPDLMYRVGDSTLTVSRVIALIPQGLSPADSLAMFNAIVDDWLFFTLLEKEASVNYSEYENIETQVRKYRRRLLAARYRESLAASADENLIDESAVLAEYNATKERFVLKEPLVKGLLLQISSSAPDIDEIRMLMRNPSMTNIDKLEKVSLGSALQYEYFIDEWQDWSDIASLVPYRFTDAENYVAGHPFLETERNGIIYMLSITDHLPTGSEMPYEKAAPLVRESLMQANRIEFDRRLLLRLRQKAIADGTLKVYTSNNTN